MYQFRYDLAVSVIFDDEQHAEKAGEFYTSIAGSPATKKRLEEYARLRSEIRQLMLSSSDVPDTVENKFRMRMKYLRYKRSAKRSKKQSFALLQLGRRSRRRFGKPMY